MSATVERGSGRPKGYFAVDGERVPAVTTICGRFKDSGGLIYSANKVGLEGQTLDEAWYGATGIGHEVHRLVEADLHGEPVVSADIEDGPVRAAYAAYEDWWDGSRLMVEATETPLVSERYRFGGTIDAILRDARGRLCIGDWKTSNALYADNLLQIAAYGLLWNEHSEERITGGFHLVRFSKAEGDLEHRHFGDLSEASEMFLHLRAAFDLDKRLKKRIR